MQKDYRSFESKSNPRDERLLVFTTFGGRCAMARLGFACKYCRNTWHEHEQVCEMRAQVCDVVSIA